MQHGQTPFLAAALRGHVEVAGFLLDNGSSILELANVSDHQLLDTSACMYVPLLMYHCVFLLLAQYKNTALHLAARGGHLNMVKFLIPRFGDRIYEKNFFRQTCRDLAEAEGHQHVVEYLDSDIPTLKAKVSVAILLALSGSLYV